MRLMAEMTDRDIARIWLESGCAPKTITNYLSGKKPVRDASKRRIDAALISLGMMFPPTGSIERTRVRPIETR